MINAEGLKLPRHVLAALVVTQTAQPLSSDIFRPFLKVLESSKGL